MTHTPRYLVAIDGSPYADVALLQARAMADKLGAHLSLVHVVDPLPALSPEAMPSMVVYQELMAAGQSLLNDTASRVSPKPEAFLRQGRPAEEIVRCAAECKASLIVLGTHGRTGLSRALLGSVAEHVVRRAHASVLVVRKPD